MPGTNRTLSISLADKVSCAIQRVQADLKLYKARVALLEAEAAFRELTPDDVAGEGAAGDRLAMIVTAIRAMRDPDGVNEAAAS